jgi:hypothetical protein
MRSFAAILMFLAAAPLGAQEARRVWVLHSGVHILMAPKDKNFAALKLRDDLVARGVSAKDIVVMECPFPQASVQNPVPREGLALFWDSMDPASRGSHDAYVRLHETLARHGVKESDALVWVGYSAGGQMGLTMAHLAHHHAKYSALADKTRPYRFEMVITLGTPVGANPAPKDVKVRQYFSYADRMVKMLQTGKSTVAALGARHAIHFYQLDGGDVLARRFDKIEHPEWIFAPRVLDLLIKECDGPCPVWQAGTCATTGGQLSTLLCRALAEQTRISIEDAPLE